MRRSEVDRSKLSPMMAQYMSIKDNYEDTILGWVIFMKCFLMMRLLRVVNLSLL